MARNRIGIETEGDNGEATIAATTADVEAVAAEQKRLKKQKELLRKKKAERRAHAKQRKQTQNEQTPMPKGEDVETTTKAESTPAEEARDGKNDFTGEATLEVESSQTSDQIAKVSPYADSTVARAPEDSTEDSTLAQVSSERPNEEIDKVEPPEASDRQSPRTDESPVIPPQQPSSTSIPSEAPTLSADESVSPVPQTLHDKKNKKLHHADSDAAALTIQKALKKSLLKKTKRTLSKATSFLRHSSKILVEDVPQTLSIPTRPVIVPPLALKPRYPPSSSSGSSNLSSASSSRDSSPTRTPSHSSCSTCSSRSHLASSSSSASSSSASSARRRSKRRHSKLPHGPSSDLLLPEMPTDKLPRYGALHDYMVTRIQARVRGMSGRTHARQRASELDHEIRVEALREVEEEASVRIQAHIKGFLARRQRPGRTDSRHASSSQRHTKPKHTHHYRDHHKHPHTKSNSVLPQPLVAENGESTAKNTVAEWPEEFNLEPLDPWDELNSIATPHGEPVTTATFLARGKLRVFCGTWNLHAKKPTDDLRLWIPVNKYHVVAVGTEECVHSIAKSVVFTSKKQWEDQLKDTLGDEYVLVAAHSLTAIHNVVFVHESVLPYIHNIQSDAVATGLGNQLGNKGGVGIALCVGPTSLAFVNCHFDAHQHNVSKRNANFHRINQELKLVPTAGVAASASASPAGIGKAMTSRFSSASGGSSSALNATTGGSAALARVGSIASVRRRKLAVSECFDRVFWYGDLNYRINGTRRMIDLLLLHNHHAVLRFNDQLRIEMAKLTVFPHFQEGPLHFRPTYKFDKHSNVYDSGPKQRIPSWTDRILYLSNDKPQDIELLSYRSHMNFQTSDHRPVGAVFEVTFSREGPKVENPTAEVFAPLGDQAGRERGGGAGGGEAAHAFARVLAKGYRPSQARSEVCVVQ